MKIAFCLMFCLCNTHITFQLPKSSAAEVWEELTPCNSTWDKVKPPPSKNYKPWQHQQQFARISVWLQLIVSKSSSNTWMVLPSQPIGQGHPRGGMSGIQLGSGWLFMEQHDPRTHPRPSQQRQITEPLWGALRKAQGCSPAMWR